jgi:signal peptide peptidase SppA
VFLSKQEKFSKEKASGLKEKIAVIKINGTIGEATARKVEKALRKIKEQEDVKSVVLRVDSPGGSINACETIYEEIQDLPQKVVVSFGNVSASGGYYISANAERIFASPTTVTGSIGVVMLRMDFRGLAKRYGITFDSIPTSGLSGSYDPFYPINQQMNENFANAADRAYYRFKSLVSSGRDLDMDAVEAIAQGRVWTGEQAHEIGLVDELGGLDRAIAYAQRNFTSSGNAQVVHWPPQKSLWESLTKPVNDGDDEDDPERLDVFPKMWHVTLGRLLRGSLFSTSSIPQFEGHSLAAVNVTLESSLPSFPLVTSGVMLTADENIAIRCLLEESGLPQADILGRIPGGSSWE